MRKFVLTACLALSAAAILGLPSWATDDACLRRTVSVTAADRNWAPILDLKAGDLQGEFRGKPVKILSIVLENRPHRIVIALDASGSLGPGTGPSDWPLVLQMGSDLVQSGLTQTRFVVLIFNEKVQEQIDFSHGSAGVIQRLQQIAADSKYQVRGRTALWDTALVGFNLLRNPTSGDALYLITDGGENASKASSSDVRRRLAASGSRVFVALVAFTEIGSRNRTPEELKGHAGPAEAKEVAQATGGALFGPVSEGPTGPYILFRNFPVSEGLSHFYKSILSGYRMEIELPVAVDKWREWKLELTKEKQKQFKDSELGYARDLEPCRELPK